MEILRWNSQQMFFFRRQAVNALACKNGIFPIALSPETAQFYDGRRQGRKFTEAGFMSLELNCFFDAFRPETKKLLLCEVTEIDFRQGDTIFLEDDQADGVYLIISGEVALVKISGNGHVEILAQVGANDYFGEVGVIDRCGRSTTAQAQTAVKLAKIPADFLMNLLKSEPSEVVLNFARRVSQHLRTTNNLYIEEVVRKEKMQLVGEMAGTIIHDIRSPMSGILLAVEMITAEVNQPVVMDYCRLICRQLTYISTMVQELLDFSKGNYTLNKQNISIKDLFNDLELLNKDYLKNAQVSYLFHAADFDCVIDKNRILRVLQNLLNNAVEAFNGKRGHVEFYAELLTDNQVGLRMVDNGPGIPEKIKDRIFEPFVTMNKPHGTGLGMAIAQSIVHAHGGEIAFRTTAGKGTTFIIHLPRNSALSP